MDIKSLAEYLDQLPLYPYFILCNILVCTLSARSDLGAGSLYFSRKHPLACWLSSMLCIFSSTVFANFLLNEPVISALGNTQQVLWATGSWYLVFYSPFDIFYRICNFMPIKIFVFCMNEIHNCKAIYQGIVHASKIFEDSYVVMGFIGIVKGNGSAFTRTLEYLVRGLWSVNIVEFMHPSYSTKISIFATVIFIVNRHSEWFMISQSFVFFCVASACVLFRSSAILLELSDPFVPFENLFCLLFFGGIWDALAKALTLDERSQHPQTANLRARAMKADILSRDGRVVLEKTHLNTPQLEQKFY